MKGTRVNNGTIPECGKNSSLVYSFPQYKISLWVVKFVSTAILFIASESALLLTKRGKRACLSRDTNCQ